MRLTSADPRHGGTSAFRWAVLLLATAAIVSVAAVSLSWAAKPSQGPAMTTKEREVLKEVREIASMLRAPCCPSLTVSQHNSPVTMKMKEEIAQMVREGKGRAAIIAELKAKYGDEIAPSVIPALWKPYLYIGGPIVGLLLVALLGRWLFAHEKSPTVLHVAGSTGEGKGSGIRAA